MKLTHQEVSSRGGTNTAKNMTDDQRRKRAKAAVAARKWRPVKGNGGRLQSSYHTYQSMNLEQQGDTYGWRYIANAPARHYFGEDGRSLCRRWACFAKDGYVNSEPEHPDHCKTCEKRVAKRYTETHPSLPPTTGMRGRMKRARAVASKVGTR